MKDEQVLMVINNVPLDLMADLMGWITNKWMPKNRPGYKGYIRNVSGGYELFITKETTITKEQKDLDEYTDGLQEARDL